MLLASEAARLAVESLITLAGLILLVAVLLRARRSGALQQPLAPLIPPPRELPLLYPLAAFFAYLFVGQLAQQLALAAGAFHPDLANQPGSHDFFTRIAISFAATAAILPPLIWFAYRACGPTNTSLRLPQLLLFALITSLLVLPILAIQFHAGEAILAILDPHAPPPRHPVLRALADNAWGLTGTLVLTLGAVVIAPLLEEYIFRGLLLDSVHYHTRSAWAGILVSAVCFGLIHAQPQDILPLITLGIALGILRTRYRSLLICVLAHAFFNARTIAIAIFTVKTGGSI